ncbi:hypothetical protein G4B88_013907 [Cannabis sativa]|uniref:Uncharacterized protein n=1 Tax=Cannabis sativa TaxID=3483 RepID=A0A7J6I113_CANSA|nr:hypothetical protein G4B88_013907 [Cannabis sativa]
MAETKGFGVDVRAHTVEIHLGVTKIVIRGSGSMELSLDELELDMWRRRPKLARAVFVDDELIVTVPKGEGVENSEHGGDSSGEVWGDGIGKSMGPKRQQWRGFALHLNEMWGLNSCPFDLIVRFKIFILMDLNGDGGDDNSGGEQLWF